MNTSENLNAAVDKWAHMIGRLSTTCPCCPLNEAGRTHLVEDLAALNNDIVMADLPQEAVSKWFFGFGVCLDLLKRDAPVRTTAIQEVLQGALPTSVISSIRIAPKAK